MTPSLGLARVLALVAAAVVVGAGLAGCGDDDDGASKATSAPKSAIPGSQGDGSDAQYVQLVCAPWRAFNDEVQVILQAATKGGQGQPNQAQTEKLVAKPTAALAAALLAIKPPGELIAWHEANANQLAAVAKAYESGGPVPTQATGAQIPPAAAKRLATIAQADANCKVSGSPFGPQ